MLGPGQGDTIELESLGLGEAAQELKEPGPEPGVTQGPDTEGPEATTVRVGGRGKGSL